MVPSVESLLGLAAKLGLNPFAAAPAMSRKRTIGHGDQRPDDSCRVSSFGDLRCKSEIMEGRGSTPGIGSMILPEREIGKYVIGGGLCD